MLKQSITYTDFNGVERTELFYFNLSKSEIINLELGGFDGKSDKSLSEQLTEIAESKNGRRIMDAMTKILLLSYGERSDDGRRFEKSEDISKSFQSHAAFDVIFVRLCTEAGFAAEFVRGITPADVSDKIDITQQTPTFNVTHQTPTPTPTYPEGVRSLNERQEKIDAFHKESHASDPDEDIQRQIDRLRAKLLGTDE